MRPKGGSPWTAFMGPPRFENLPCLSPGLLSFVLVIFSGAMAQANDNKANQCAQSEQEKPQRDNGSVNAITHHGDAVTVQAYSKPALSRLVSVALCTIVDLVRATRVTTPAFQQSYSRWSAWPQAHTPQKVGH